MKYAIVVPWYNKDQIDKFLSAWNVHTKDHKYLILQQDKDREGCAVTKNKGIMEAIKRDADVIMVLDDDCYTQGMELQEWVTQHLESLEPADVELYEAVTDPPSRGTPYFNRTVKMPVAASMGFWRVIPDWGAVDFLAQRDRKSVGSGPHDMLYKYKAMFWRFFPFSGMNCAFKRAFWPYFRFDEECPRFDDIFMGYKLQYEAYKRGFCINLNGPMVQHVRQSNVWENLKVEAQFMERNETEWCRYV